MNPASEAAENLKRAFKAVLDSGGQVRHPYKIKTTDWMVETWLFFCEGPDKPSYITKIDGFEWHPDAEAAIDYYCRHVFTKRNLGLLITAFRKRNPSISLDDFEPKVVKHMVQAYAEEFFEIDFPFASAFAVKEDPCPTKP